MDETRDTELGRRARGLRRAGPRSRVLAGGPPAGRRGQRGGLGGRGTRRPGFGRRSRAFARFVWRCGGRGRRGGGRRPSRRPPAHLGPAERERRRGPRQGARRRTPRSTLAGGPAVKFYASDMWDPPRWDVAHLRRRARRAGQLPPDLVRRDTAGRRVTAVEVYDANAGISCGSATGRKWHVVDGLPARATGRGAGRIDWGATVRAVAAAGNLRLDETVIDGRPAWTVTCTKGEMAGLPPSKVDWLVYTVAVDKETWLLVRVGGGRGHPPDRLPVPRPARRQSAAPGRVLAAVVARTDRRALRPRVQAGHARPGRDTPGVTALVPGFVPDGYELSGVAIAPRAWTANHVVDPARLRAAVRVRLRRADRLDAHDRGRVLHGRRRPLRRPCGSGLVEAGAQGGPDHLGRLRGSDGPDPRGDDDDRRLTCGRSRTGSC